MQEFFDHCQQSIRFDFEHQETYLRKGRVAGAHEGDHRSGEQQSYDEVEWLPADLSRSWPNTADLGSKGTLITRTEHSIIVSQITYTAREGPPYKLAYRKPFDAHLKTLPRAAIGDSCIFVRPEVSRPIG